VLYGSYASGNVHTGSDLDLAIISPDFGKNRFEEGKMLLQIAWRIDPRLEPIPISSESYEKATWVPLIYEIKEKGIELEL
jgi:predicted nucleotidyltransferase